MTVGITGGNPVRRVWTPEDLRHVNDLYEGWRLAQVGELVCSRTTFEEHLNHPQLIAGPWKWTITSMRHGDVKMFGYEGFFLGTVTVTNPSVIIH